MNSLHGIRVAFALCALVAACGSDSSGDPPQDANDADATPGDASAPDSSDVLSDGGVDADPADAPDDAAGDTLDDDAVAPDATEDVAPDASDAAMDAAGDAAADSSDDSGDTSADTTEDATEPTACELLACETLNRLCVEPIEPTDVARCGECAVPYVDVDGDCVSLRCINDRDCPGRESGEWGSCEPTSLACTTVGEERRAVYSPVCETDGVCATSEATEGRPCVIDPIGLRCQTELGRIGECRAEGDCVVPEDAPLVEALPPQLDVVRLRIVTPTGASSVRIYRDGVAVDSQPASGTGEIVWTDTSPELSRDVPGALSSFVQETDPEGTRVRWTPPPLPTGTVHRYEVSAVVSGVEGRRSEPDDAWALGPAPDGLRIQFGSDRPLSAPVADSYLVGSRVLPPGSYDSIVTSVGEPPSEAWVALRVNSFEVVPGDPIEVTLSLRNVNGSGPGSTVAVRSQPGEPSIVWQRAPSPAGPFADLPGVSGASAVDTTAAPDGTEAWYRPLLRNRAASDAFGPATPGGVVVPNYGIPCTTGVDCPVRGAPAWCPTNTSERVCTPRPVLPGGIELPFVTIPAGSYTMGSPTNEVGRVNNEDAHTVQIPRRFAVARTELTRAQWRSLTGGSEPLDSCSSDDCPVRSITIYSAMMWANALSRHMQLPECYNMPGPCSFIWQLGAYDCTGTDITLTTTRPHECEGYRLCNEAEWEYAARAGVATSTPSGNFAAANTSCYSDSLLNPWAHYCIGGVDSARVAQLQPNAWGLYDVLGNVLEYVWDSYTARLGTDGIVDPWTATFGASASATARGGRVGLTTQSVRHAAREFVAPGNPASYAGVRLCRSLD